MTVFDYASLAEQLARAELALQPAELHGIACGLLVVDSATPVQRYQQLVLQPAYTDDTPGLEIRERLRELYAATQESLHSTTLEFEPLLPDDDEPLDDRFAAACDWARGCLYGLIEQGLAPDDDVSEDVAGFIDDLVQISRGGYAVDEAESAELIYADLLDFLRLGALMTQEELQPVKAAPQQQLH